MHLFVGKVVRTKLSVVKFSCSFRAWKFHSWERDALWLSKAQLSVIYVTSACRMSCTPMYGCCNVFGVRDFLNSPLMLCLLLSDTADPDNASPRQIGGASMGSSEELNRKRRILDNHNPSVKKLSVTPSSDEKKVWSLWPLELNKLGAQTRSLILMHPTLRYDGDAGGCSDVAVSKSAAGNQVWRSAQRDSCFGGQIESTSKQADFIWWKSLDC